MRMKSNALDIVCLELIHPGQISSVFKSCLEGHHYPPVELQVKTCPSEPTTTFHIIFAILRGRMAQNPVTPSSFPPVAEIGW